MDRKTGEHSDEVICHACPHNTDNIKEEIESIGQFKRKLEETLDEYFPKMHEENEAKKLNKRAEALMLYSEAVIGVIQLTSNIKQNFISRKNIEEIIEDNRPQMFGGPIDEPENHAVNETLDDILKGLAEGIKDNE